MKHRPSVFIRLLTVVVVVVIAASGGYLLGRHSGRAGSRAANVAGTDLAYLRALIRPVQATAGDPIFMQYGSIKSGGGTGRFAGWIPLTGWQWAMRVPPPPPDGRTLPVFTPVTVSFRTDQASPLILKFGAVGRPAPGPVRVVFVTGTHPQMEYLQVTLKNVTLSTYSEGSSGGQPTETLSLNVGQFEYQANPPKGQPVKFCWDLSRNVACTF
jgi:type VI protein secretion system component Hcp